MRVSLLALLASVTFHILLAGILLANSTRVSPSAGHLANEHVIQVQLHRSGSINSDMPDKLAEAPSFSAPSFPIASTDEHQDAVTEAPLATGILLPPLEPPYIPASELTVRPQPQEPIVIPFPDAPLDRPKATAVLMLFIGADGRVDRVEIDESDMPISFEKAAIDTFLQARMNPGIKDGKNTRARMKILVEFEAR